MSGWQAGQERRERKAAREEEKERWQKQFDLQQDQYKETVERNKVLRMNAITDRYSKGLTNVYKFIEAGQFEMATRVYDMINKAQAKATGDDSYLSLKLDPDEKKMKEQDIKNITTRMDKLLPDVLKGDKNAMTQWIVGMREYSSKKGFSKETLDIYQKVYDEATKEDSESLTTAMKNYKKSQDDPEFATFLKEQKEPSPSPITKMINERNKLLKMGYAENHPDVAALDRKIKGDPDIVELTDEEVAIHAANYIITGKLIPLGRGRVAAATKARVFKSVSQQLMAGTSIAVGNKTPMEAALAMVSAQSDTKSIQKGIDFLEKQFASMGSFVKNIAAQAERVQEISDDLKTFDTRLLNVPLRAMRKYVVGDPNQSKYDIYITELDNETAKLSTGATASVAELSATAQEKWDSLIDKNLSIKDMLKVIEEVKIAADTRVKSVQDQLAETRSRMRTRKPVGGEETGKIDYSKMSNEEFKALLDSYKPE